MFKDELHLLGANHVWMMTRRVYRGQWRPGRTPTVDELRHMPIGPAREWAYAYQCSKPPPHVANKINEALAGNPGNLGQ